MRWRLTARLAVVCAMLASVAAIVGCGAEARSSDTRPLVTFARSGGIAGKAYSLVVDRGGGATLTTYPPKVKEFKIDGDKRDKLVALLGVVRSLDSSYEPARPTADDFRYSITYQGTTVQASGSAKLPAGLRSLIGQLDGVLNQES